MPITSSAKKALKRSEKLQEKNIVFKNSMKNSIKKVRKSVIELKKKEKLDSKDHATINGLLQKAYSAIDKAEKRNILHKNSAARRKSRLAQLVTNLGK